MVGPDFFVSCYEEERIYYRQNVSEPAIYPACCSDCIGLCIALQSRGVMACCVLGGRFSMAYAVADRSAFCICSIKLHTYF